MSDVLTVIKKVQNTVTSMLGLVIGCNELRCIVSVMDSNWWYILTPP